MSKAQAKIQCSVSVLTLNSAKGLSACLSSLRDFAEVIVCDGNSTDGTQKIARAFGARVIRQYDTDEPETPCAMDKAAVRERAMQASTLPWRFFMDSDDSLSAEVVEEIRFIVSSERPDFLLWRMPTRIFLGGESISEAREIKHEASYPAYQIRLVHESVGARFRGAVHERLVFDAEKFPVGDMRGFYNFHWPEKRVLNYWAYLRGYAERELRTGEYKTFRDLLYWGLYRRARTILGYLLWRLPFMYAKFGFRESMPLSLELTIVRYHFYLLFGAVRRYFQTRIWWIFVAETLNGKDLNRILSNLSVAQEEAYGRVLDVGGGRGKASYWRYLQTRRWHRVIKVDVAAEAQPDFVVNLEEGKLPFKNRYFDTALMFNLLEHVEERGKLVKEVKRVLKPGGSLLGIVPFMVGVHPDPHDFVRLTEEGLRGLLLPAGFSEVKISTVGWGPVSAAYIQLEFIFPRFLKILLLLLVWMMDKVVSRFRPGWREKFPLSYSFRAQA